MDTDDSSGACVKGADTSIQWSGRLARLIELDPKYVDVIVRRWQDWTGQKASRESDGVAFESLIDTDRKQIETIDADDSQTGDVE